MQSTKGAVGFIFWRKKEKCLAQTSWITGSEFFGREMQKRFSIKVVFNNEGEAKMDIRKLMVVVAATCIAPVAAFAQASGGSDGGTAGSNQGGGSAGDGDHPLTYTTKSFTDIDKNKNGVIETKEAMDAKLDASLVKKMDTNGDGRVSQAEFDAFQATTSGNQLPARK